MDMGHTYGCRSHLWISNSGRLADDGHVLCCARCQSMLTTGDNLVEPAMTPGDNPVVACVGPW